MMTLTQAKQTIRKIRAELLTRSTENLEFLVQLNPLYRQDLPEEDWELLRLRKRLERRLLDARLGRSRRSSIQRASEARTVPFF